MNRKVRLKKVIFIWCCLIGIGLILAMILIHWNMHLPCLFREMTGYLCPGCGVTRMFKSLICLDLTSAFQYNPVIFLMLPFIIVILINVTYNYVKRGSMIVAKPLEKLIIVMIVALICFGIIRNF